MSGGKADENRLKEELRWMGSHTGIREYMMVSVTDTLDDDIPF